MKKIRAARAGSPATTDGAVDRCNSRDPTPDPRWDACSADGHMAVKTDALALRHRAEP